VPNGGPWRCSGCLLRRPAGVEDDARARRVDLPFGLELCNIGLIACDTGPWATARASLAAAVGRAGARRSRGLCVSYLPVGRVESEGHESAEGRVTI